MNTLLIADELDGWIKSDELYAPRAIVVKSCRKDSGCCLQPGQVCSSVPESEYQATYDIQVQRLNTETGGFDLYYRNITWTNHGKCKCVQETIPS